MLYRPDFNYQRVADQVLNRNFDAVARQFNQVAHTFQGFPALDPRDFEARGDGVHDDTAAFQAATTAAVSSGHDLNLEGIYRITSPINIDRPVDTTHKKFYIRSSGGAVLYVDSAINMFSSTLTDPTAPQSENIEFQNITFRVDDASRLAYVLHGIKFLRVCFNHCTFDKIKCLTLDRYLQTFMFAGCYIKYWQGEFLKVYGDIQAYDIAFIGNWIEAGGTFFKVIPTGSGLLYGIRYIGNLIEGLSGRVIVGGNFRGLKISGNYFEYNATDGVSSAINLDYASYNYGVELTGNMLLVDPTNIDNPTYYEVNLGPALAVKTGGNYCSGRLYDNTVAPTLNPQDDFAVKILAKTVVPFSYNQGAAPTTGTHNRGDKIWNPEPSAGGSPGWICTASGTFSAATDATGDTDGSTAVITGMTDTSDFTIGDYVTVSAGFPTTGPYRIMGKTASSITLDVNSTSAQSNVTVETSNPVFKAMAILAI